MNESASYSPAVTQGHNHVPEVRGLAQMIEEEPDLFEHERAALLRATRRMLAEADAVLGWISQVPLSGARN